MEEIEIEQIEIKEDSAAKINAVAGLPTKNVLFANEFNAVVKAIKNAKIIKPGELSIYKVLPNQDNTTLEVGDFVQGFVQGQFVSANYLGGDPQLLESYGIENPIEPTPPGDG
ncbi:hypothetical protein [Flavobacterium covae]|uniref:hypothetical protein n=1 Tax=Flavobacterium covae TaxID=2906076 RepID=UPI000745B39B|nr:hypothetical protein [Flavobacterium covae]AMA49002.1 hypothetical protein AWN65_05745 [Flavobacterium covae]MCJ1809921.1 hypothetical protein [Flavobacterium covae]